MGDPAVALRKRKRLEMHTIYQLQFLFCMTIHSNLKYIIIRGKSFLNNHFKLINYSLLQFLQQIVFINSK